MTNRINFPSLTDHHSGAKHFRNLGATRKRRPFIGGVRLMLTPRSSPLGCIAQRSEHAPYKGEVDGSIPSATTISPAATMAIISALITVAGFITFVVIKLTK